MKAQPQEQHRGAQAEVRRASLDEIDLAYSLVTEYYQAANVVARESKEQFQRDYFTFQGGVWLAWVGDQLAGCIALRAMKNGSDGETCAEIKRMYVRRAWRGHGIAQRLLEGAEGFAATSGYDWIYLDTAADMHAAARLYERRGYQPCPRYNDNPQAAIFMRKSLTCR